MTAISNHRRATHLNLTAGELSQTEIVLGRGILKELPAYLSDYSGKQVILVSDESVAELHAASLRDSLSSAGFNAHLLTIPAGERSKTLETMIELYSACHDLRIGRHDLIVGVGGGVVGDIAAMLAGTYLRGLDVIQIPTTLLAMASSSFGGKGGVNFRGYKSLIGMFKHPLLVLADLDLLDTLPAIEFRSGLGELITVGVLGAPEIFEALESDGTNDLENLIIAAIRCKMEFIKADPYDRLDVRAKLHLGHNFGHALEKLSGFTLPHGLAVSVGLHIASRLAAEMEICPKSLPERIHSTLLSIGLPGTLNGYEPEQVITAMRNKAPHGRLRVILPTALGQVIFVDEEQIPLERLRDLLKALVSEGASWSA